MMMWSVVTIAAIGILLTVLPFLSINHWVVRSWEFPRIQLLCWLLMSLGLVQWFSAQLSGAAVPLGVALFACILYQSSCILPYTPLVSPEVELSTGNNSVDTVTVLASNVLESNDNSDRLLDVISENDPDIVLLAEVTQEWLDWLEPLNKSYAHTISQPQNNFYGMALYSKFPLVEAEVRFLIESDIPSIHTWMRLPSGKDIRFIGVHPQPPSPTGASDTTERDAELVTIGRKVKSINEPVIVAGDLNDVAWSKTTRLFRKLSGLLDPRIGRGLFNSFHATIPILRFPLDHIFHSTHFRLVRIERLNYIGSDHFPIFIELSLEESAEITQPEPEPTPDEKQEAGEIMELEAEKRQAEEYL